MKRWIIVACLCLLVFPTVCWSTLKSVDLSKLSSKARDEILDMEKNSIKMEPSQEQFPNPYLLFKDKKNLRKSTQRGLNG